MFPTSSTAGPVRARRTAARSWLHTDAPTLSLERQLALPAPARRARNPRGPRRPARRRGHRGHRRGDFDDSSWDADRRPGPLGTGRRRSLRAARSTRMSSFPSPPMPPNVPDENPTGDYRRTFELPESWTEAERILLRFDGVESRYKVWVNGVRSASASGAGWPRSSTSPTRCARDRTCWPCACTSGRRRATSRTRTSGGCRASSAT